MSQRAESMRDALAGADSLPLLTLLGLLTGLIAGTVIVLFRWIVKIPLAYFLPDNFENFEAVSSLTHLLLPLGGAVMLGLILQCVDKRHHATSIGQVMDRLQNHQGRMPPGNMVTQFFGGATCLLTGQSVGREGPAVHMGVGMPGGVVGPLLFIGACLTTRWVFRCDGLFQNVLRIQGKFRSAEAMEQLLSRTGVRGLMDRHLVVSDSLINLNTAHLKRSI